MEINFRMACVYWYMINYSNINNTKRVELPKSFLPQRGNAFLSCVEDMVDFWLPLYKVKE